MSESNLKGIEGLRILTETTFDNFPDATVQAWISEAVWQYDAKCQEVADFRKRNTHLRVRMSRAIERMNEADEDDTDALYDAVTILEGE
ncbi:hypothetical protein [Alteromonas sp. RKMC-009]|uniref:hypothetical protein n=1 Tax=Alteromonas sp. RKMC-009 TaxID=2267264 RepID=UPI000E6A301C|nr:hypothetical protein [Alteromonas sp. RKMC-009]AYA64290.1 hypothetical protein DS731_09945 [Alteromonas sp. RKMC-009]